VPPGDMSEATSQLRNDSAAEMRTAQQSARADAHALLSRQSYSNGARSTISIRAPQGSVI
jgi:hypothetical protein